MCKWLWNNYTYRSDFTSVLPFFSNMNQHFFTHFTWNRQTKKANISNVSRLKRICFTNHSHTTYSMYGVYLYLLVYHQNIKINHRDVDANIPYMDSNGIVSWLPNMSSEKAFRGTPNVQNKITHQLRLEDFGWRLMFVDMRLTNHTWMSWLCTFILGFAFVADVSNLLNMGVSWIHQLQSSYLSEICLRKKNIEIWFQMMIFHGDLAW